MYIIGGSKKNHRIAAPKSMETRPTSSRLREALFNICQHKIEDSNFLDLFAGSGAIGLEALSRGASFCTFVDNSKESVNVIRKNVENLGFEKSSFIALGDVITILKSLERKKTTFDIIYVDPPYEKKEHSEENAISYSEKIIREIDAHPFLLKENGFLFIEDIADFSQLQVANLSLISSRKAGKATLTQFKRQSFFLKKAATVALGECGFF